MKKLLKSFKHMLLLDEDPPKIVEEPPANSSGNSEEEQRKTGTNEPSEAKQGQGNSQPLTRQEDPQSKEEAQPDKTECSARKHHYPRREMKNPSDFRLFVGGLPDDITKTELRTAFEKYGKVSDVTIVLNKETNKSKRFGFVGFENENSAKACLDDHFVIINEKRVEIKKAWPRRGSKEEIKNEEKHTFGHTDFGSTPESLFGSSSTGNESKEDLHLLRQKLFDDYFKAKFLLQNLVGSREVFDVESSEKNVRQRLDREIELEKMLTGFYISTRGRVENLNFYDETEASAEVESACAENYLTTQRELTEDIPPQTNSELSCNLCEWTPWDKSLEGLLAHYSTPAHRQRLKERFKMEGIACNIQNEILIQENLNKIKKHKKQCGKTERQNASESEPEKNKKNKTERELLLQEIMTSLGAETDKCIKCKSKGHMRNILALENSVQNAENFPKGEKQVKTKSLKQRGKKFSPKRRKARKNSETAQNNKFSADEKEDGEWETSSDSESPAEMMFKKTESLSRASNTKVTFLCLRCNYFCAKPKTFVKHLNSDSHLSNVKEVSSGESDSSLKNTSELSLRDQLTNCSRCGRWLYGSSLNITNHFFRCKISK